MYTHTKIPKWSRRTSFTTRWNVDGALQMPKGRTPHSKAHHIAVGGGMDEVSGGVHLDVGVLRLPHRVDPHGVEELVNTGGETG